MRDITIDTESTQRFDDAVDDVLSAGKGASGFILAYGQAGRGKSVAADRYFYNRGGAYVRVWEGWSQTAFLQRLLFEINGKNGDLPNFRGNKCKEKIVDALERKHQPIFIDEADRLSIARIEDLRDIFEYTSVPIVLIGEEGLTGLLSERRRIWSRVVHEVVFSSLSPAEVALYATQAADLIITPVLCSQIVKKSEGDFRLVRNMIVLLEKAAKAKKDYSVDQAMLDLIFQSKSWRRS